MAKVIFSCWITLYISVKGLLLGNFMVFNCTAGPVSAASFSFVLGVRKSMKGWVVPISWLSTLWKSRRKEKQQDSPTLTCKNSQSKKLTFRSRFSKMRDIRLPEIWLNCNFGNYFLGIWYQNAWTLVEKIVGCPNTRQECVFEDLSWYSLLVNWGQPALADNSPSKSFKGFQRHLVQDLSIPLVLKLFLLLPGCLVYSVQALDSLTALWSAH